MRTGAAFFALGVVAGTLHCALLRWNTALYLGDGRVRNAVAVQAARLVSLAGLFAFAVQHGALPLLLTALRVLSARSFVIRWMAEVA